MYSRLFFRLQTFSERFFYISAENFSSVQELFFFQSMKWVLRGRMGVVLHNSPLLGAALLALKGKNFGATVLRNAKR